MNLINLIDQNLNKILPSAEKEPRTLHEAMRYSVFSGGKRIRPVILIEAAQACGGSARKAVAAACAIELIHTYSLIHDDLPSMDDDDYRRGKPSCHKKFGEANAILAGDALLTLAFKVLASEYAPKLSVAMAEELASAIGSEGMAGGQALDIEDNKDLKKINHLKTAKLFEASAVLGALSASAPAKEREALRKYGFNSGMAFQAVDDIIDGENKFSYKDTELWGASAKAALKVFGSKAGRLKEIIDHVLLQKK